MPCKGNFRVIYKKFFRYLLNDDRKVEKIRRVTEKFKHDRNALRRKLKELNFFHKQQTIRFRNPSPDLQLEIKDGDGIKGKVTKKRRKRNFSFRHADSIKGTGEVHLTLAEKLAICIGNFPCDFVDSSVIIAYQHWKSYHGGNVLVISHPTTWRIMCHTRRYKAKHLEKFAMVSL